MATNLDFKVKNGIVTGGTVSLDDDQFVAWGGGVGRTFIAGNKATGFLRFGVTNTERMRITVGGAVLVGTTTQLNTNQFGVLAPASTNAIIAQVTTNANSLFQGFNASGVLQLQMTGTGDLYSAGTMAIGNSTIQRSAKLFVNAANTTLASTTANVYVNTTNNQAVDVGGSMAFGGKNDNAGTSDAPFAYIAGRKENGTTGDFAGYFQVGVTQGGAGTIEAMRITSIGNMGLGTTAPTSNGSTFRNIDLRGTSGGGGFLYAGDTSAKVRYGYSGASGGGFLGTIVAEPIIIQTNSAEAMRVGSNGNVAIGTTSTDVGRLTVTPPVFAGAETARTSQRWTLGYNGGANGYSAYLKSNGNFGYVLNTDWGARLSLGVNTNTANDDATFVEHLSIVNGGNVGVGTTSPANYGAGYKTIALNGSTGAVYDAMVNGTRQFSWFAIAGESRIDSFGARPLNFYVNGTQKVQFADGACTFAQQVTVQQNLVINSTANQLAVFNTSGAGGGYATWQTNGTAIADFGTGQQAFTTGSTSSDFGINARIGSLVFGTAQTERMRISNAGNVGIGRTPSALARLDVQGPGQTLIRVRGGTGSAEGAAFYVTQPGSDTSMFAAGDSGAIVGGTTGVASMLWTNNTPLAFQLNGAERMRISTGGAVGIGEASPAIRLTVSNTASADGVFIRSLGFDMNLSGSTNGLLLGANSSTGLAYVVASGSAATTAIVFGTAAGAAPVERMRVNTAGITVTGTVTETSTIRVKKNVRPIEGALETVMGLQGIVYDLKDDSAHAQHGLIAEEVQKVLPNVVYRDEDGEIAGVQYARIVAVLIEAMKEQESRIKALEAIIAKG